jgi:hypothetical protein
MILLLVSLVFSGTLKGPPRPKKIFAVVKRGSSSDIIYTPLYRGSKKYYTKDSKYETSLQCHSNHLIYTSGNKIYWQNISKPRKEHTIGSLPNSLVSYYGGKLRRFIKISPDGTKVLWPKEVGFKIRSFKGKFSQTILPPTGRKVVHPVSWRPGSGEIFFMTHDDIKGRLIFHFRAIDKIKDRLLVSIMKNGISGISSFETHWSKDGKWLAVNLDAKNMKKKKPRRYFVIINAYTGKVTKLPKGWRFSKFHGFNRKNNLIVTASNGGKLKIYKFRFHTKRYRMKYVDKLYGRKVYGYFPGRNILLLNSHWKKCRKPRLFKATLWGQVKRILRWTKWSEIIAMDKAKEWGIFRGGSVCKTSKPSLYMMRMDGSLLLRELPKKKFRHLRQLAPSQIAICK